MHIMFNPQFKSEIEMGEIAVVFLGSIFRSDDAIGRYLVENLRKDIDIIDGGTRASGLIDVVSNYEKIILIDAIDFGSAPGDLDIFNIDDLDEVHIFSTHTLNFREVVELSKILYGKPKDVVIIGIQPADISFGIDLSEVIKEKMVEIKDKLLKILEAIV